MVVNCCELNLPCIINCYTCCLSNILTNIKMISIYFSLDKIHTRSKCEKLGEESSTNF